MWPRPGLQSQPGKNWQLGGRWAPWEEVSDWTPGGGGLLTLALPREVPGVSETARSLNTARLRVPCKGADCPESPGRAEDLSGAPRPPPSPAAEWAPQPAASHTPLPLGPRGPGLTGSGCTAEEGGPGGTRGGVTLAPGTWACTPVCRTPAVSCCQACEGLLGPALQRGGSECAEAALDPSGVPGRGQPWSWGALPRSQRGVFPVHSHPFPQTWRGWHGGDRHCLRQSPAGHSGDTGQETGTHTDPRSQSGLGLPLTHGRQAARAAPGIWRTLASGLQRTPLP